MAATAVENIWYWTLFQKVLAMAVLAMAVLAMAVLRCRCCDVAVLVEEKLKQMFLLVYSRVY
jgi:hypothetical protein